MIASAPTLDNPISARISDLGSAADDLVVFDCASRPAEEVSQLFGALDAGAGLLLLDATEAHKEALAAHVGFRSQGAARGYFVARRAAGGKVGYHFHEATDAPEEVADFIQGIRETLAMPLRLDESTSGPVEQTWTYTTSHPFTAVGPYNSDTGLGPTPDGSISLQLKYVFEGALDTGDNAGPFQYIGCTLSGILSNGGLVGNTGETFGWILANFNPSFSVASDAFSYSSSSPANTSGTSTVQTGYNVNVGVSTGSGASATYNYSNSITNSISEWNVVQTSSSSWNYAQATPFDGNATDNGTIDNCIDWAHGNGVQTGEFPAISTSTLQFAVNTVWKTNGVVTDTVLFYGNTLTQVDYIMTQVILGATNKECSWVHKAASNDAFYIDMSKLS